MKSNFEIKQRLMIRKEEILETLNNLESSSKPVDLGESIGRLSRMDAIQHQQMALNSKKKFNLYLKQLDQAMIRLEEGEYGICLKCEEEISEKRLDAKPETPFCMKCQES